MQTPIPTPDPKIPKLRSGTYFPSFLHPRTTSKHARIPLAREAYITGIRTRKVDDFAPAMGMSGISKSQVSPLCQDIDDPTDIPQEAAERALGSTTPGTARYAVLPVPYEDRRGDWQDPRPVHLGAVRAVLPDLVAPRPGPPRDPRHCPQPFNAHHQASADASDRTSHAQVALHPDLFIAVEPGRDLVTTILRHVVTPGTVPSSRRIAVQSVPIHPGILAAPRVLNSNHVNPSPHIAV